MILARFFAIIGTSIAAVTCSFSQTVTAPNFAMKSHETLEIKKIEISSSETIIFLSVENRAEGGYFCADRNIFILYPDGNRVKLNSSKGIPVCPDTYKFNRIGERLDFTLTFPPIEKGTDWIDLVEECADNCFSFYGLTLDADLNKRIDEAFNLAEKDEPVKALAAFINIAEGKDTRNLGVEGLLYINIIKLAKETDNSGLASRWYQRMKLSGTPRLEQYIIHLNAQGIRY